MPSECSTPKETSYSHPAQVIAQQPVVAEAPWGGCGETVQGKYTHSWALSRQPWEPTKIHGDRGYEIAESSVELMPLNLPLCYPQMNKFPNISQIYLHFFIFSWLLKWCHICSSFHFFTLYSTHGIAAIIIFFNCKSDTLLPFLKPFSSSPITYRIKPRLLQILQSLTQEWGPPRNWFWLP